MKPTKCNVRRPEGTPQSLPIQARVLSLCVAALFLAACGGLNNAPVLDPLIAGTSIPTSATTTSDGAAIFVKQIVLAGPQDVEDALIDGDVVLAKSDTDEPDQTI